LKKQKDSKEEDRQKNLKYEVAQEMGLDCKDKMKCPNRE
jgi:hypothetical protein